MNVKIVAFSPYGDKTILEYDLATADMDEVNRVIANTKQRPARSHSIWQPVSASRRLVASRTQYLW